MMLEGIKTGAGFPTMPTSCSRRTLSLVSVIFPKLRPPQLRPRLRTGRSREDDGKVGDRDDNPAPKAEISD